jgi:hypothetical protein
LSQPRSPEDEAEQATEQRAPSGGNNSRAQAGPKGRPAVTERVDTVAAAARSEIRAVRSAALQGHSAAEQARARRTEMAGRSVALVGAARAGDTAWSAAGGSRAACCHRPEPGTRLRPGRTPTQQTLSRIGDPSTTLAVLGTSEAEAARRSTIDRPQRPPNPPDTRNGPSRWPL